MHKENICIYSTTTVKAPVKARVKESCYGR